MASPKHTKMTKKDQKIADKYEKKTQLQHIIDLPDTYIGTVEKIEGDMYIFDDVNNKIIKRNITYIPGFERIFEEIILNSFDQTVRPGTGITTIKINIDKETGIITVWNDGKGIPIVFKESENVWIPEMIFGTLLTSGNYKKGEVRIAGGRNGMGSKLTNIFSTEFKLETIDEEKQKKFVMTWKNNMSKKSKAKITDSTKKGITKITYTPDYKRFGLTGLTDDIISLMKKRVYDIAANSNKNISVYYNGKKIPIKKLSDYMKLYIKEGDDKKMVIDEDTQERWSVGMYMSEDNFEQVSFVNGVNTNLGGTHVEDVSKKIIAALNEKLKKKKLKIKNSYIKDKMFVFVKSFIENPSFNSQTKEFMTSRPTKFGSRWEITDKFIKGLTKLGIIEEVTSFAQFKETKALKKTDGKVKRRLTGIPKLDDANWAGTKKSSECLLILTEGDSAKAFAMSGLSKIGRDQYGVFPLKGKLLNVKDQSNDKIGNNAEITYLKQILGLKQGMKYKSVSEIRYGGIIILTDQDVDGSHIKGLVMNMFHTFWPELLKLGFVKSLITPIVKAFKGSKELSFYTITDYENWRKGDVTGWKTKYYKGLGTSNAKEAKSALENIQDKLITYTWDDLSDKALHLGFNKTKADDRKKWLLNYNREDVLDQKNKEVSIPDFINKDLIHFSNYDNHRSIPSIIDGLKPTQRKILFTGLKYLTKNEIKVAQFSGLVGQKTDYHHGEASIVSTVVGMAQNFVGANNCNLYMPNGQFGTRLMGGKDRSSERYIFTNVSKITRTIFNKLDDNIVDYINSDGLMVEPTHYVPSIPMILINGTTGIGTGFSTSVLPHKLEDVVKAIQDKLDNKTPKKLTPWVRSFTGSITEQSLNKYMSIGKYELDDTTKTITITELPVGTWTENYKQFIEDSLMNKSASDKDQKKQFIQNYYNYSTESTVKFILELVPSKYDKMVSNGVTDILKKLKLSSNLSETNMYLFNKDGQITKFKSTNEILDYYYNIRLEYYDLRKQKMIETLLQKVTELQNRVRFIRMVKAKEIDILETTEEKLNKDLEKHKFTKLKNIKDEYTFDYLVSMAIRTLTLEKANKMEEEYKKLMKELEALKLVDIKDMWREDLEEILKENKIYNDELQSEIMTETTEKKVVKKRKIRKIKEPKTKKVVKKTKKVVKKKVIKKKD